MRPIALLAVPLAAAGLVACGGNDNSDKKTDTATRPAAKAATPIPDSSANPTPLAPGKRYATGIFRPRVSFTLPDGSWRTAAPETPSTLGIGLDAPPPTRGATLSFMHIARVFDPVKGGRTAADGKPAPRDFLDWLRRHPRLKAGAPVAVEVGGVSGRQLDVTVVSAPKRQPEECQGHGACLPLYLDGDTPIEMALGDRMRYLELEVAGRPLTIEMYVGPGSQFEAVVPQLEAALKGFLL